jgi:hypothetical protein
MDFILNGHSHRLDQSQVIRAVAGVAPEDVRDHGVRIEGMVYPVKQAFGLAMRMPRSDFTSHTARRHLAALGFEVVASPTPRSSLTGPTATSGDPHGWPWEGAVQAVFGQALIGWGWTIASMADTATKAHGVDLVASRGDRTLGAEVKGWPSKSYADPRRSEEVKKTQPSTQAGHWFSQALLKALMLLDSHPSYESLAVLPDFPRYRDLAHRTRTGRAAAGLHVVFVRPDGGMDCETWSPQGD